MTKPTRPLHVWMYARASQEYGQLISPERQEVDLLKRVERFVEKLDDDVQVKVVECVKEYGSASKIAYDRRPGFQQLLEAMQKGDVLIVEKLDRIDRDSMRQVCAVKLLAIDRKIRLIVLEDGGKELDFNDLSAHFYLHIRACLSAAETKRKSEDARAQHARMRANGIAVKGGDRYGVRYIKHPAPPGQRHGWSEEVLDPKQIKIMREIYERHEAGESMAQVGESFERRGVRNRHGESWVTQKGGTGSRRYNQLYRAYKAYKRLLEAGKLNETCLAVLG